MGDLKELKVFDKRQKNKRFVFMRRSSSVYFENFEMECKGVSGMLMRLIQACSLRP
jgi:hypothetical protein